MAQVWGSVFTLAGDGIGALLAFQLARHLGRPWLLHWLGPARAADWASDLRGAPLYRDGRGFLPGYHKRR